LPNNAIMPLIWTFANKGLNRSFSLKAQSPTILRDNLKNAGTDAKGDFTAAGGKNWPQRCSQEHLRQVNL
jgi:hypothetical protein